MSNAAPLVSAEWLKSHMAAPDVRVVDATWAPPFLVGRTNGREQYEQGHIPGAVFFDIDEIADPDTQLSHMLPDPVLFSSRVRRLGLGDGNRIIVYDNNGFFASARVWWMFRAMGHQDISVLDGGYQAWLDAGGDVEDLPPITTERHFTARKRADLVKDRLEVAAASQASSEIILDARSQARFDGTAPEPREGLPSGHIPGSHSVPVESLLTPSGTLIPAEEIQQRLAPFLDKPVITTCGSGVSAAVIALALAQIGKWDAAVYDGSWSEWAAQPDSPIATS